MVPDYYAKQKSYHDFTTNLSLIYTLGLVKTLVFVILMRHHYDNCVKIKNRGRL